MRFCAVGLLAPYLLPQPLPFAMDELARVRAEQARKYAQEKAQHGPPEAAAPRGVPCTARGGVCKPGKSALKESGQEMLEVR